MSIEVSPPFLAAAKGLVGAHTPVWFMRQAGRSLPEYRAIRGDGSILDAIARPDLAAEITLQPVRRYGVDAAVLFSDIVVPAHAVGFGIDVTPGTGPVAAEPLRHRDDLRRLRPLQADDIPHVAETVRTVAGELGSDVPVLAFAGAPFTVASYLIEGRPSRTYEHTKALARTDEALWHEVMERLASMAVTFIDVQLEAGARAFQLFDSWAGALSAADYERLVLPHSRRVFAELAERHPECPRHPLRDRVRSPAGGDVGGRSAGDRPRLAHLHRGRPSPPRCRCRRAGQPRPGARARRGRRRPRRCP